ncbi:MAG: hypothetical protein ACRD96_26975, partial [Bryobacteraceae bacterium]
MSWPASSSAAARLRRLASMGPEEIRVRAGQEIRKRLDLAATRAGRRWDRPAPPPGASRPKFFFAPEEVPEILGQFRLEFPDEARATVDEATRICRHEFDLLGYRNLALGPEIEWRRDPVHGVSTPLAPWYR